MNVTAILNWVVAHHTTLLNVLFGAAGLSVGLEALLTKFKVNSKKMAFTLLHVFSALTALASFGLGVSGKEATGIYASLALVAGWWHRFVISDANEKYITPFLNFLSNQNTSTPTPSTASVTVSTPVPGTTSTTVSTTGGDAKPFTLDSVNQPVTGK